jgi:hypothetical protein
MEEVRPLGRVLEKKLAAVMIVVVAVNVVVHETRLRNCTTVDMRKSATGLTRPCLQIVWCWLVTIILICSRGLDS